MARGEGMSKMVKGDALYWADHFITVRSDSEHMSTDEALSVLAVEVRRLEAECAALKVSQNHLRDIVSTWIDMHSMDMGDYTEVKTEQWEKLSDIMLAAFEAMQAGEKP